MVCAHAQGINSSISTTITNQIEYYCKSDKGQMIKSSA